MSQVLRSRRRVEFVDTDMAGIAHFSNFFRWMEAAEVDFLQARGLSVRLLWEGQQLGFPRVSATCDYLKPARFEEMLDVAVTLENLGRKSATYLFEFTREGVVLAKGKVTSVCCRVSANHQIESIDIPPTLRAKLLGQPEK